MGEIVTEEIEEVHMKSHHLQSSIDELVKDADELANTAQEIKSLKALERSNDLRKAGKLKIMEISKCDLYRFCCVNRFISNGDKSLIF